jgi:CMP-N-acetylneuraminic acid synthetase
MLNKTFTCIIPARGGSKRIPNKNIRDICGKPLIAWTIEAAQKSKIFSVIWVNSDDELILNVAANYGAKTYKRPPELGTDDATTESVIREQLKHITHPTDFVMVLQPTSPTRKHKDIKKVAYKASLYSMFVFTVNVDMKRNGSIYIAPWDYMLNKERWIYGFGKVLPTIDIDTEDDWKEAECLLLARQSV